MQAHEFSTDDHWRAFAEFCYWEKQSGGPDPQIAMVHAMSDVENPLTRVWRALCYIAPYNVPFGELMWEECDWEDILSPGGKDRLRTWLDEQFAEKRIVTRFERRCVRRADWMHEYMHGAAVLTERWGELRGRLDAVAADRGEEAAYELAWTEVLTVPRLGRYVAIKLLDLLRRHGVPIVAPDIRPKDAWSPRETLGLLWEDHGMSARDNSTGALNHVRNRSAQTVQRLWNDWGVRVNFFELQVLLCEYRESWEGKKQYPGRSLDSELAYGRKYDALWGEKHGQSSMWQVRHKLFPHDHLGELRGWEEPRKDVARVLSSHGYTWSDAIYSYKRTAKTGNFSDPVPHAEGASTKLNWAS